MDLSVYNHFQVEKKSFPILLLSGVGGDTRRYRTLHAYQQLCLAGIPCILSHLVDRQLPALVAGAQIVLFHRVAMDDYVRRLVDDLHQRGGLSVLDIDDLLFDPQVFEWIDSPDFKEPVRAGLYREEMKRYQAMLEACDAVIAATDFLARRVQSFDKPAWIYRNAFSSEMAEISELAHRARVVKENKLVIGYASGTLTHNKDFAYISPVLQKVLQRHPQVELHVVGQLDLEPEWKPYSDRIRKMRAVDWRVLPQVLAGFDINLAPLVMDNPFNQSKSAIKYIEAALVGIPTIASPTGAFRECIQDGQNGLLAGKDADWLAGIERLLDFGERQRMGEAAYRAVYRDDSPEVRSKEWSSQLRAISEKTGKSGWIVPPGNGEKLVNPEGSNSDDRFFMGKGATHQSQEKDPSRFQQGLYSLRHRGLRTVIRQVWAIFRRSISRAAMIN